MKKIFRRSVFVIILSFLFIFCFAACNGGKTGGSTAAPDSPAPLPSAAQNEPSGSPAAATPAAATPAAASPTPTSYAFDAQAHTFSDEYIAFTLPEALVKLYDSSAEWSHVYERYITFFVPGDTDMSVDYYIQNAAQTDAAVLYANFEQADFEALLAETYDGWDEETTINTLRFEKLNGANYTGVIYEMTATVDGYAIGQLIFSAINSDGIALNLIFTNCEPAELNASLASIKLK